jgi:hypothetical protein
MSGYTPATFLNPSFGPERKGVCDAPTFEKCSLLFFPYFKKWSRWEYKDELPDLHTLVAH